MLRPLPTALFAALAAFAAASPAPALAVNGGAVAAAGGAGVSAPPPPPVPAPAVAPPHAGGLATLRANGTAAAPKDAPPVVREVIAAANRIARKPYLWGGGHAHWRDRGYDCSGSVSFALHGGALLDFALDSTGFMSWGERGPGHWITIYANREHAFMVVAGLRFDTSGADPSRWQADLRPSRHFRIRHPVGY